MVLCLRKGILHSLAISIAYEIELDHREKQKRAQFTCRSVKAAYERIIFRLRAPPHKIVQRKTIFDCVTPWSHVVTQRCQTLCTHSRPRKACSNIDISYVHTIYYLQHSYFLLRLTSMLTKRFYLMQSQSKTLVMLA